MIEITKKQAESLRNGEYYLPTGGEMETLTYSQWDRVVLCHIDEVQVVTNEKYKDRIGVTGMYQLTKFDIKDPNFLDLIRHDQPVKLMVVDNLTDEVERIVIAAGDDSDIHDVAPIIIIICDGELHVLQIHADEISESTNYSIAHKTWPGLRRVKVELPLNTGETLALEHVQRSQVPQDAWEHFSKQSKWLFDWNIVWDHPSVNPRLAFFTYDKEVLDPNAQ